MYWIMYVYVRVPERVLFVCKSDCVFIYASKYICVFNL